MAFKASMSKEELAAWLKTKGLDEDDCRKIEINKVNGQVFSVMEPEDLARLGVSLGAEILLKRILTEVKNPQATNRAEPGTEERPSKTKQLWAEFTGLFQRRPAQPHPTDVVTKTPKWVPFCTKSVSIDQPENGASHDRPQGVAGAWVRTSKLWRRRDVLFVYFLNPDVLRGWKRGDAVINVDDILAWAEEWYSKPDSDIPILQKTDSREKADIRVGFKFDEDDGNWSMVGTDAKAIVDKTEPTMNLALEGLDPDFLKSVVIHEFGHSLGLEHEHQRSDFWKVLKDFVDLDRMKEDPDVKGVGFTDNWLKLPEGGDSSPYDSDSVMHYWFKVEWLKDEKYRTLEGVEDDTRLTEHQKIVLKGINKRNHSFVPCPSATDLHFLEQCYTLHRNEPEVTNTPHWGGGPKVVPCTSNRPGMVVTITTTQAK